MTRPIKVLVLSSTRKERDGIAEYTRQVFRPATGSPDRVLVRIEGVSLLNLLKAPFQKCDIVHVQHEFFMFDRAVGISALFYYLYLWLGSKLANYKIITTFHSSYNVHELERELPHYKKYRRLFPLGRLYLRFHFRWVARLSTRLIVLSQVGVQNLRNSLSKPALQQRVVYVPHGNFSPEIQPQFHGLVQNSFGITPEDKVFVLFGFAFPNKNYELGIAAMNLLVHKQGRVNAKLVIVSGETAKASFPGGGQGESYLGFLKRQSLECHLEQHVFFTGYLPYADPLLEDIFASSFCFLFPYHERSFASGALSTVLAAGKPLLVSDIRAFKEYDGLLSFPENDSSALAAQMARLMDDPAAVAAATAITQRNAEQFRMDRIFARHLEVYREALGL